jgi:hypothetical protein
VISFLAVGVLVLIATGCGAYKFVRRRHLEAAIAKDPMKGFSPAATYAPPMQSIAYPSMYDPNGPPQYPEPVAGYPFVGIGAVSLWFLLGF